MAEHRLELEKHLTRLYAANVLGGYDARRHEHMLTFKSALDADPGLQVEANTRLAELDGLNDRCNGALHRRDFVGAKHRDFLRTALGKD